MSIDQYKAKITERVGSNGMRGITGEELKEVFMAGADAMQEVQEQTKAGISGIAQPNDTIPATGFFQKIADTAQTYTNYKDSGNAAIVVTAADLDVVSGVANNRVILRVNNGVATKRVERVKGDAGSAGVNGKTTEAWTAKAFVSGSNVYYGGAIWESNADTLATDVPGTSAKWVARVKPATNFNIAPEFNVAPIERPSSLAALQTADGVSINTWNGYIFEFPVSLGKYIATPLNVWINGRLTGTGMVRIRTYLGASVVATQDVSVSDFNGNKFIGVLPAGNYDKIYIYFGTVSTTDFYVKDVYVGTADFTDSKRVSEDAVNVLKNVNPIQRSEWFTDENRWKGVFTKENENTFIASDGLYNKNYRIEKEKLKPFLEGGKMYVSFLVNNDVANELGFYYSISESGVITNVGNTLYMKNQGVWKEYKVEIPITANTDYVTLNFQKRANAGTSRIKNFIVSEQPHRQGNTIAITTSDFSDVVNINPFPNFTRARRNPAGTGYSKTADGYIVNAGVNFVPEQFDVSKYAGKTLYIKFETSTVVDYTGSGSTIVYRNSAGAQISSQVISIIGTSTLTIPPLTVTMDVQFKAPTSSSIIAKNIILSETFINSNATIKESYDLTKVRNERILNIFPFKALTPVSKYEASESLPFVTKESAEYVLSIQKNSGAFYEFLVPPEKRKVYTLSYQIFSSKNQIHTLGDRSTNAVTGNTPVLQTVIHSNENQWDNVYVNLDLTNISKFRMDFQNKSTESADIVKIKNIIISESLVRQPMNNIEYEGESSGFNMVSSLVEAQQKNLKGVFSVGSMLFKNNTDTIIDRNSYEIIGQNQKPTVKKMFGNTFIDLKGYVFSHIDRDQNIWITSLTVNKTWKLTRAQFEAALSAPVTRNAGFVLSDGTTTLTEAEAHRELIPANLPTAVYNAYILGMRDLGNNEVVMYMYGGVVTSSNNKTVFSSPIEIDLKGGFINGWLFDARDNVVVIGGYFSGDGSGATRGKGKLWISTDYGKTFKNIFDAETTSLPKGDGFHIHGCAYDQYWNRVWMVVGDSTQASTPGKVYYCDNHSDATPTWTILPYNRDSEGGYEQWCTVYPMKDSILFGADMNPTTLSRMARIKKTDNTLRETMIYINDTLSHVPSAFYRWDNYLPLVFINGVQNSAAQDSDPAVRFGIFCTINGNDYYEVFRDKIKSVMYDTQNTIYYLPDHTIWTSKKDVRFSDGQTMIMGKLGAWY